MPVTTCNCCGGDHFWKWEEAFDKFGFCDGGGQVETYKVETVLKRAGYDVDVQVWGIHNTVITSIRRDGKELIDYDRPGVSVGYDDPRDYLPEDIVDLLDRELPEMEVLE